MTSDQPPLQLSALFNKKSAEYFALGLVALLITVLPLWMMPIEFWEGRRVNFAMTTDMFGGQHARLFELQWPLQYFLFVGIKYFGDMFTIHYRMINHFLATIVIAGIAVEVGLYARRAFQLPCIYALLAALLALLFPAWTSLINSDYLMRAMGVWFVLMGYRLICKPTLNAKMPGVCLLLLCYQHHNNFFFLAGVAGAEAMMEYVQQRRVSEHTLHRTIALLAATALFYVLLLIFVRPYGLYENYNPFLIPTSLLDVAAYYKYIRDFTVWPLAGIGLCLIGYIAAILPNLMSRKIRFWTLVSSVRADMDYFKNDYQRKDSTLWPLVLLFACVALPWAGVHESPKFWHFNAGDEYAYGLVLPVCLCMAMLCKYLMESLRRMNGSARFLALIPLVACAGFVLCLCKSYSQKAERAAFELGVLEALKADEHTQPTAGLVSLYYPQIGSLQIEPYEVNWLLWRAYHKTWWLAQFHSDIYEQGVKVPKQMEAVLNSDNMDEKMDMLIPHHVNLHCQSIIALTGERYTRWVAWKWLFGFAPLPAFRSELSDMRCG